MKNRRMIHVMLGTGVAAVALALLWTFSASGHCQIPCGIYNDPMRFTMMEEEVTTIEKSMKQIVELSKEPGKNANQLVRWVQNKDNHADQLAEIVTQYFLQQRIAPVAGPDQPGWDAYVKKLALCHGILVEAMKCKQTTDLQHVRQLQKLIKDFHTAYFPEKDRDHDKHPHEHAM